MIGWKQAFDESRSALVLVKLHIPSDARVVKTKGRGFYRCDRAQVVSITSPSAGRHRFESASSLKDPDFIYRPGETVVSTNSYNYCLCEFCGDPFNEFGPGIYFFKTKKEALEYEY